VDSEEEEDEGENKNNIPQVIHFFKDGSVMGK